MAGHIFISYSKRDSDFAFKLADRLIESGRKVWIDRQIEGGERWRTSILQALRDANESIVILSPRSVGSAWVMHEGSVASGLDKPLFPVLMEPVDKLPVWMEELQYIDFHAKPFDAAFEQLLGALTPPNPLQDLLDQQVKAHQQTGELIGEALLHVLDEEAGRLTFSEEAASLIARSKKAVTYRRRLVRASAGAAIALSIIALIALVVAIRSGGEIAGAQRELATARAEIGVAEDSLARQESEVSTAQAQQAVAQAEVALAQTEQAVIERDLATATAAIGAANQKLVDAQARLNSAEAQLVRLFETTGTVPVGDQPRALLWNGDRLWVANGDGTLMQVNVHTGMANETFPQATVPSALAWDGRGIWIAFQESNLVRYLDPTGTTLAEVTTEAGPIALAWDGRNLWVANWRASTVQRISPADSADTGWAVTATVTVGAAPRTLLWDGGALWVANRDDSTVQAINPETGVAGAPLDVGAGPAALAWDGRSLWVANRNDSTIMQLNPATRRVLQTIDVNKFPSDLLWDGASLWVTNDGQDSVLQIDPESGDILLEVQTGRNPRMLAWDGEDLWAANQRDNAIVRVRADQKAILETLPLAELPAGLVATQLGLSVISASGGTVRHLDLEQRPPGETMNTLSAAPVGIIAFDTNAMLARADGSIQQVIPATGRLADRLSVPHAPSAIAYDGDRLWVTSAEENIVYPVNPYSGAQVGRAIMVGAAPRGLLWDGARLWVANTGDGTVMRVNTSIGLTWTPVSVGEAPRAMAWDGESLWVASSGSNTLAQIAPSGVLLTTIPVEANPVALAWDGISLWVACKDSNTVQQIDPLTATVQATVPVDDRPIGLAWDGEALWVATEMSTLQKINTQSLNLIMLARRLALQTPL